MNIASLLPRVTSVQKNGEQTRRDDYLEMVRQVAEGEEQTVLDQREKELRHRKLDP